MITEWELIKELKRSVASLPDHILGIGDDCAVIQQNEHQSLLVTTDLLVEQHHFIRDEISPEDLGHKSLAVNLSDIAAMGGAPTFAFLSLAIPKDMDSDWLQKMLAGFQSLADEYNVLLLGGDTSASQNLTVNVTVIGTIHPKKIKTRSGAKVGDVLAVTGFLGDSRGGLLTKDPYLYHKHVHPSPQIDLGQKLAACEGIHAMMDLSDGLASDIERLAESSGVGFSIELSQLPISDQLKSAVHNPIETAAIGGEDYCLLVSCDPSCLSLFKNALHPIGKATSKGIEYFHHNHKVSPPKPFAHFSS